MDIQVLASSSAGNCYLVSDGHSPLLLDCGIRFSDIRRGVKFGVSGLAGCLITHEHGDHSKAVKDMMKAGVEVFTSPGTAEALGITGHHRLRPLRALEQVQIGTWTVLPFDAVHDAAEPLSFLLASGGEKLLYLTDSSYCRYRFQGLTHLLVEANHSVELLRQSVARGVITMELKGRILRNHLALERLLEFLAANDMSQVQSITLIHLSDANSNADEFKRAVMRATGRPVYIADA